MHFKRLSAFAAALAILISSVPFIGTQTYASSSVVLSNLNEKSAIENAGLVTSSLYTDGGSFSAKWGGTSLKDEITVPVTNAKYIGNGYIEAKIYSANKTDMKFGFILNADNPETAEKDYYYASVTVNWTGWRKLAFRVIEEDINSSSGDNGAETDNMTWEEYDAYVEARGGTGADGKVEKSSFKTAGSPLPINSVTDIKLRGGIGGSEIISGTTLYFDSIVYSEQMSSDALLNGTASAEEDSGIEPYVIYDFSTESACNAKNGMVYSTAYSNDGTGSAKFAAPNLTKDCSFSVPSDWSKYNTLNIEAYNVKNTGSRITICVTSENNETEGSDYYFANLTFDWEGEWKTLKYSFSPDGSSNSTFSFSRTPLGWDKINDMAWWTGWSNNKISEDTECYFKRIYLSYEKNDAAVDFDSGKDYIPTAKKENITQNIEEQLRKTTPRKQHPRLDCTPEELEKNIELWKNGDPYLTKVYKNLILTADKYLTVPDPEYGTPDGKRLVSTDREAIKPLAVAYRLTGEQKYRDRLWSALATMESWPDWNPSHLLCTSEASHAFAQAYDICYDFWTEDEKRVIRNGMMRNGIETALNLWRVNGGASANTNNWQEVCSGGFGVAALSMIDEPGYMDICSEMICQTIRTLPKGLAAYAPDGGFPEGAAYWSYASGFFFRYDNALFNTLGTDYGLSDLPGLKDTGYFPLSSSGPGGSFNFSDGGIVANVRHCVMFWIAERYDEPEIATYFYKTATAEDGWEEFLTYRDYLIRDDYRDSLKLDYRYNSDELDVIYSRASWYDNNATWFGAKGGSNAAGHGDLDVGQFVLDMQGIRWFSDLGQAWYEADGMWITGIGGGRWKHYRKRAEAHNTLVFNPDDQEDQYAFANCKFTDIKSQDNAMYAILDMSDAYHEVESVKRGYALINNRNDFIVQDEIQTKDPVELYSFFTTQQEISIDKDNPSKAILTAVTGQKIRMDITSPEGATWEQMEAVPLPTSPNPVENSKPGYTNEKYHKLFIHMKNAVNPTISVSVKSVYSDEEENADASKYVPISNWDSYLKETNTISNLYVDGIPVEGFSKSNSVYSVDSIVGNVTADYDSDKVSVEITQGSKLGDTAICKVTDKQSNTKSYYYVTFNDVYIDVDPTSFKKIPIVKAEASHVPEAENVPENSYDGNFNTRWSADGEAWIIWDLDGEYEMNQILLSFWKGDQRATKFKIYTSTDRQNWDLQFDGIAAGNTEQLETFKFKNTVKAKYVKFAGSGNTVNEWNSILEVYMPQLLSDFTDTVGHWALQSINQMRLLKFINGTSETTFNPDANATVAEFTAMIARCIGLEEKPYTGGFTDVSSSDWYADIIQAASDNGIIPNAMISDGALNPNKDITREEAAAILMLAYKSIAADEVKANSTDRFADKADINPAYNEYIGQALTQRFLTGRSYTEFAPKATATRAEAATILKRLYIAKSKYASSNSGDQVLD